MNYEKNYYDYITYVKTLNRVKGQDVYYEEHHILPKSMGGTNNKSNLILLTAREHYLAHYLLWKIYNNREMQQAFWFVSNFQKKKISSKQYELLREQASIISSNRIVSEEEKKKKSEIFKGEKNPNFGKKSSDKRIQILKNMKGKNSPVAKKIICIETGKIYDTITEASRDTNTCLSSIIQLINNKGYCKTAGGYHWQHYTES